MNIDIIGQILIFWGIIGILIFHWFIDVDIVKHGNWKQNLFLTFVLGPVAWVLVGGLVLVVWSVDFYTWLGDKKE